MQHPFQQLQSDYANCLAHMAVTRPLEVDKAAKRILRPENINRYLAAVIGTGVPSIFVGALDLRESDCNPYLALGQGDPWNRVSTHVPKGFGPFSSWAAAAKFYIHYDHLSDNTQPWTMEYVCWKGELWNGFGPRAHGRRTGYLWAGTNLYDPPTGLGGKYIADGEWSPTTVDVQLGIIPVILRIAQLRPDLAIDHALPNYMATMNAPISAPAIDHVAVPTVKDIQHMLNMIIHCNLVEDGSYGRKTRAAVRTFQKVNNLAPDGICGPLTSIKLESVYHKTVNKTET